MNRTLIVDRDDFYKTEIVDQSFGPLKNRHIRVEIGPFALTANNITYMAVGDQIGYWKFFDPDTYGLSAPSLSDKNGSKIGRMPVWGYGIVSQSSCEDVSVGTKIYGFFPIANTIDIQPAKISPMGFMDGSPHRRESHPIYNYYMNTDNDPSFTAELDLLQPVLRPLFTTSFLIGDMFAQENYFDTQQIVVISASAKTALGTAFCLKGSGRKVVGLTSPGNVDFTQSTEFYDGVTGYDDITSLDNSVPTALIDMAGNGAVNAALYDHFGDSIIYNCMVGKSHWQGDPPPKNTRGARPIMFFAPARAQQRVRDWGPEGFAKNLGTSWLPFCQSAKNWLEIKTDTGEDALMSCYLDLLAGRANPATGRLFTL